MIKIIEETCHEIGMSNVWISWFGKGIDILGAYAVAIGANFTSNDLLLPFPQIEIGLSKGLLEQNPGY